MPTVGAGAQTPSGLVLFRAHWTRRTADYMPWLRLTTRTSRRAYGSLTLLFFSYNFDSVSPCLSARISISISTSDTRSRARPSTDSCQRSNNGLLYTAPAPRTRPLPIPLSPAPNSTADDPSRHAPFFGACHFYLENHHPRNHWHPRLNDSCKCSPHGRLRSHRALVHTGHTSLMTGGVRIGSNEGGDRAARGGDEQACEERGGSEAIREQLMPSTPVPPYTHLSSTTTTASTTSRTGTHTPVHRSPEPSTHTRAV